MAILETPGITDRTAFPGCSSSPGSDVVAIEFVVVLTKSDPRFQAFEIKNIVRFLSQIQHFERLAHRQDRCIQQGQRKYRDLVAKLKGILAGYGLEYDEI